MRCCWVEEGWVCHMSLHKKPIKAYGEKERTSELHSSSVFILLLLIPIPPPLCWITNWNPKWLTDSRHHVSTVRAQSSGSLTERVPSHLYPGPSPKAILERGWTIDLTLRINSISRLSLHFKTWISEVDPKKKKLHSLFELWERSKVKPSFKHSVALF